MPVCGKNKEIQELNVKAKQAQGSSNPKLVCSSQSTLKHFLLQTFLGFPFCKETKSHFLGQPLALWSKGPT